MVEFRGGVVHNKENSAMQDLIVQFSLVVGLATAVGVLLRFLRQPLIIAYLTAGLTLSAFRLVDPSLAETLKFLPEIGIAFLLFLVGIEMDFRELKQVGRAIFIASVGQILITFVIGMLLLLGIGFQIKESLYLAVGLSFSSTILVVKFLTERKEILSLHGKLAVGILLVEDLVAIIALMLLSIYNTTGSLTTNFQLWPLLFIVLKGLALFYVLLFLAKRVLPHFFRFVAVSQELLFLSTISWCLLFVAVTILLGFSLGIGAFLAGLALATSPYRYEIAGKLKPLRDFFIALFFIDLGATVSFLHIERLVSPVLFLSLFVLVSKPLMFMAMLGRLGYSRHTITLTASSLTHISEFSLILVAAGARVGHVGEVGVATAAFVGIVTMTFSSLLMAQRKQWYPVCAKVAALFERSDVRHPTAAVYRELEHHVVLIGCHRIGSSILSFLKRQEKPLIVLDFDPKVIEKLSSEGVTALFGSISDPEILDQLHLAKADLIISTVTDLEDNLALLSELRSVHSRAKILMAAQYPDDAYELYRNGAHFVILPYAEAGDHMSHLLAEHIHDLSYFEKHIDERMRQVLQDIKLPSR